MSPFAAPEPHRQPPAAKARTIGLDIAQELEARSVRSALDTGQWTLHGRRNRGFVLSAGRGGLLLDGEETPLAAPCLIWLPVGKPAELTLYAGSRGAWIAAGDLAMSQIVLPSNMSEDLRRLMGRIQIGTRIGAEQARRLTDCFTAIEAELHDAGAGSYEMIRHQLAVVCIMLWRLSGIAPRDSQPMPRVIVANFLQLIDAQMRNNWSIADYADYLGVSPDRLNTAVRRALGRSPLATIHARQITEARQMLESSGLQIAEIARHVGIEDPAYFSRFFKRMTGKSPRRYRADFAQSQTRLAGSFAAWP